MGNGFTRWNGINKKIKSVYPYKYLLILDKDYYQFKNLF